MNQLMNGIVLLTTAPTMLRGYFSTCTVVYTRGMHLPSVEFHCRWVLSTFRSQRNSLSLRVIVVSAAIDVVTLAALYRLTATQFPPPCTIYQYKNRLCSL